MLVNGQWSADWHPVQAVDKKGGFVRQTSGFRHQITPGAKPVLRQKRDVTIYMSHTSVPGLPVH